MCVCVVVGGGRGGRALTRLLQWCADVLYTGLQKARLLCEQRMEPAATPMWHSFDT